jgi:DNA-binding NarL/FixJ family response regulator
LGKAWARARESWNETPSHGEPIIAVIDDHRLLSSLLVGLLGEVGYHAVDLYAPTPEAIVDSLDALRPRLTFLDHELGPAGYGLGLVDAASRHGAAVALTASTDRLLHAAYLEAGADGVVAKTGGPSDIIATVELVLAGEPVTTESTRHQMLTDLRMARARRTKELRPFESLTQRERETLQALCNGESAATMAQRWVVSMATVRSHIRSVLLKLGVSSQLEAAALANRAGWSDLPPGESPILMMTRRSSESTMGRDERKSAG